MKKESGTKTPCALLNKSVFGFFDGIVSKDKERRLRGACDLINFLCKDNLPKQSEENGTVNGTTPKTADMAYALKRLVRGVGGTENVVRASFFTTLVGLLSKLKDMANVCPSVTELLELVKKELGVGNKTEEKKTRFGTKFGSVLVCGAIIKSGLLEHASKQELQAVLDTLKEGMFNMATPLVYTFLNELAPQLDGETFSKLFFPTFQHLLNVPKEQHTIDTTYFLLMCSIGTHRKLMDQKFIERNFGASKLLHSDVFEHLTNVLFNISTVLTINHPFYDCLLEQLIKEGMIVQFMCEAIVPILEQDKKTRPKYCDVIVMRILISVLGRLKDYSCVPELLHPSLVKFLLQNLKNRSECSEDVRDLFQEACNALVECYPKIKEEKDRLATFRRLTQAPGSVLIEKYARCKLLQNLLATLSTESLKSIGTELKALILDESSTAINSERSYAAQMLHRLYSLRQITTDAKDKHRVDEQRLEVVRFFLTLSVFYSADGVKVLKSSQHDTAIAQELATTLRRLFFHSLDYRHAELSHEWKFLFEIVRHVHDTLQSHGGVKSLRNPLTDEQANCWNRMYATVVSGNEGAKKSKKRSADRDASKLTTVFHILLMHMGLHLFSDPKLAASSLVELECVMKRIGSKGKKQRRQSAPNDMHEGLQEEPEWIEVAVDLFLNLLSQNSHLLRNVIVNVFPHLSGEMTLTAFNQILSVINLKDNTNPLIAGSEAADAEVDEVENEEEETDNDDESDVEGKEKNGNAKNKGGSNGVHNDEDDDDDDDEDEELMGDEEEEEHISDKMRLAVQQALGGANPETDTESVDLDEMDEEQGRQLDVALAEAFRAFRKAGSKSSKQGPTKVEQQMDTVLTHFRMRVFDLVDVYLKHQPDMIICLELMLYVFEMLPIAIREESKYGAILKRYKQIFNTLIHIKDFRKHVQDVDPEQLDQFLRDLIEKVAKGVPFPDRSTYLMKAFQFIVICSQTLENGSAAQNSALQVDKLFGDQLVDFLTKRNPPIPFNVFKTIFGMPWHGNLYLAVKVATSGLKVAEVRAFRRIQTMELLREFLCNHRFVRQNLPLVLQSFRTICTDAISPYVVEVKIAIGNDNQSIGNNELYELMQLLMEIYKLQSLGSALKVEKGQNRQQISHLLDWEKIGSHLQEMSCVGFKPQIMILYRQLCDRLRLTPIKNGHLTTRNGDSPEQIPTNDASEKRKKKQKKKKSGHDKDSGQSNAHTAVNDGSANRLKGKRTKDEPEHPNTSHSDSNKLKTSMKEKRQRKQARLQSASKGMEAVSFANGV